MNVFIAHQNGTLIKREEILILDRIECNLYILAGFKYCMGHNSTRKKVGL